MHSQQSAAFLLRRTARGATIHVRRRQKIAWPHTVSLDVLIELHAMRMRTQIPKGFKAASTAFISSDVSGSIGARGRKKSTPWRDWMYFAKAGRLS